VFISLSSRKRLLPFFNSLIASSDVPIITAFTVEALSFVSECSSFLLFSVQEIVKLKIVLAKRMVFSD
jgi:hypothetical protein